MRVVAGVAGGIPLKVPKSDIRPTMDLVRGAVFSMLGERVPGARVLDLFSGTGALGIEAMSRGAAFALLVDSTRECVETIRANLLKTGLSAGVVAADVFGFLSRPIDGPRFDLIFADPPYSKKPGDRDLAMELLLAPALPRLIESDGLLLLETARSWEPQEKNRWRIVRQKVYGATAVWLFSPPTDP